MILQENLNFYIGEILRTKKKNSKKLQVMQNEVFLWQQNQNGPGYFSSELFSADDTKPAAYAPEKGPMSGAACIDKRGREPGSGLTPDKKEARVDLGSGSDASAALAALGGGPALQSSSITG